VLGATIACQSSGNSAPPTVVALDTAAIRAAIDTLASKVMRAHETGDAELFASTWAVDGIMSDAGATPIV
jgi:hypothetical protein